MVRQVIIEIMNVYFYTGFWSPKRIEGYVVHYSTNCLGNVKAVVVITKSEEDFLEYAVGSIVAVPIYEVKVRA